MFITLSRREGRAQMGDLEVREKTRPRIGDSQPGGRENESGSRIAVSTGQPGLTDRHSRSGPLIWVRTAGSAEARGISMGFPHQVASAKLFIIIRISHSTSQDPRNAVPMAIGGGVRKAGQGPSRREIGRKQWVHCRLRRDPCQPPPPSIHNTTRQSEAGDSLDGLPEPSGFDWDRGLDGGGLAQFLLLRRAGAAEHHHGRGAGVCLPGLGRDSRRRRARFALRLAGFVRAGVCRGRPGRSGASIVVRKILGRRGWDRRERIDARELRRLRRRRSRIHGHSSGRPADTSQDDAGDGAS